MNVVTLGKQDKEVIWNGYMRAGYAEWPVGMDCPVHSHHRAAEVFIFVGGECEITVGDEVKVCKAGQTVYVGPGEPHRLKSVGNEPLQMFLVVCPNHEPTHTMHEADGALKNHNRQPPTPEQLWIGKDDI